MQSTFTIGDHVVPVVDAPVPAAAGPQGRQVKTGPPSTGPVPGGPPRPSPRLLTRAEATIRTCRKAELTGIRPIAVDRVFDDCVYHAHGTTWSMIVVPAGIDPTRSGTGRFPVPPPVYRRLKKAVEAGVEFDRVYVAHELDGQPLGSASRFIDPAMAKEYIPRPPSTPVARGAQRFLDTTGVLSRKALKAAGAAAVTGAAVAMAMMPLDPAIFGVLVDDDGRVGVWFSIDAWIW